MSRSGEMLTHKDLDIWKKGIKLVENAYKLTAHFPKEEIYGLVAQIRRAAISIPSNIAEGAARNSTKEFIQSLYIALGSLSELETQFIIAEKLEYCQSSEIAKHIEHLRRMLLNFIKYLKRK